MPAATRFAEQFFEALGKPADDWRVIWESVYRNLRPYFGRWQVHQCDSATGSRLFDDGSLDFVFIDADHTYEGCLRDILAWAPKVKPGGWIGGHDYGHPNRRWGASGPWTNGRRAGAPSGTLI